MPILSHQSLIKITRGANPIVRGAEPIADKRVQMSSIDLTLGDHVYSLRSSALPRKGMPISDIVAELSNYDFELDANEDKLLLRGNTYVVPLNESVCLPKGFSARFTPKSSIGRIDLFVRVLGDGVPKFDGLEEYDGRLYLEITPLSFSVNVRKGQSLAQMRIRQGATTLVSAHDLALRHAESGIVWGKDGAPLPPNTLRLGEGSVFMHADLDRDIVGFRSRNFVLKDISLAEEDSRDPEDFWEPIARPNEGFIVIEPGVFYLLATRERIRIPPDVCGEMAAYDASAGEFRTHYAGFFDPGFGGEKGTVGVMEIRGRELPFCLRDGQPVCRMDFEQLDGVPDILYGESAKESHYTGSGASLSKFFRRRQEVWKD
jgi:dCTP deaminase